MFFRPIPSRMPVGLQQVPYLRNLPTSYISSRDTDMYIATYTVLAVSKASMSLS